jgi:hypothetical protein
MTDLPNDPIDPYEPRLARRVGAFSDQAVQPIDAAEIARTAVASVRGSGVRGAVIGRAPGPRLGWIVLAGAAIAAVAFGSVISGGHTVVPTPTQTSTTVAAPGVCDSSVLAGRILRWDGAAGNRIATIELKNTSAADCLLTPYRLSLVDRGGRGQGLILGRELHAGIPIASGATVHTLVDVSNYCLAYLPVEPVSIRLDDPLEHGDVVLAPVAGGLSGVPPCNGAPGSAGSISQQPWAPGAAPSE